MVPDVADMELSTTGVYSLFDIQPEGCAILVRPTELLGFLFGLIRMGQVDYTKDLYVEFFQIKKWVKFSTRPVN